MCYTFNTYLSELARRALGMINGSVTRQRQQGHITIHLIITPRFSNAVNNLSYYRKFKGSMSGLMSVIYTRHGVESGSWGEGRGGVGGICAQLYPLRIPEKTA